jgi:DNA-binding SARP family transcriptional activator/TolB-like protein
MASGRDKLGRRLIEVMLLHVRLLGGFECRSDAGELVAFPTRKVRALFAYLAVNAGRPHARDRLAGLLWGDRPDEQARADLRKSLSRLRGALPAAARGCLLANGDGGGIALRPDRIEVDVTRFERLAADGTPDTLERAAALHAGELLPGFEACGEEFEAWLSAERRCVDETLRGVLRRLLDHRAATGAVERAIRLALRLLALDPLQESVHRTLIRLYLHQDRVGSALEQYHRCRDLLAREIGVEPAPDTERLKVEILKLVPGTGRGDGAAVAAARPEVDELPEPPALAMSPASQRAAPLGLPSVVVLPFAVAPGETGGEPHLGAGVAEDVATELGRFRDLQVVAPASALAYRDAAVPPERVGAELGTAYVLHGSLRLSGNRLRITARLVESESGVQVWAERYDGPRGEVFATQDDLVRRIVGTLVGRIEDAQLETARRKRPDDWRAYDLWLRGWSALRRPDLAAIGEARRCFQRAVAQDPHFARAYVGLAMAQLSEWACFSWNHWFFPRQEVLELARTAVALDERDHRAHCMLGVAQLYGGDDEAARRELQRALELNPNDADVLAHAAAAMALLGEHGLAVEAGRAALRLAPHHPEWYAAFAGIALFAARLYQEAIDAMTPAPEALCNTPAFIAASHAQLGHAERAAPYRDTVHRHHRHQLARGLFPSGTSCIDWLLAMDPFRRAADAQHYLEGLRKAGFR